MCDQSNNVWQKLENSEPSWTEKLWTELLNEYVKTKKGKCDPKLLYSLRQQICQKNNEYPKGFLCLQTAFVARVHFICQEKINSLIFVVEDIVQQKTDFKGFYWV